MPECALRLSAQRFIAPAKLPSVKSDLTRAFVIGFVALVFPFGLQAEEETFDYTKENLGALRIGQSPHDISKILPSKPVKGEEQEWGADGLFHQEWSFINEGITIGMVAETKGGAQTVFYLRAKAPCALATAGGIRIGSSKSDVLKAYGNAVNSEESLHNKIVVGSIYGGVIFELTEGNVSAIFIGAAAE